jgi:F-type H+-transporting ATPase subunit gamma
VATLRDIKRRIDAIDNTKQITRAMYMVAAAKLQQAEERVNRARPYAAELAAMLGRLADEGGAGGHPLLEQREAEQKTYVVITGDRGLCGSYNANVLREAELVLGEEELPYELVTVGKKGRDQLRRNDFSIFREYSDIGEEISYEQARDIAVFLARRFAEGETDRVIVLFTEFKSALSQNVQCRQWLPVTASGFVEEEAAEEESAGMKPDHFFEPSAEELFDELLPRYTQNQFYQMLMESKASEHGARMTAMKNATDNAEELIETLTLDFNRARQAAITREISEIVGGAEAIKQN